MPNAQGGGGLVSGANIVDDSISNADVASNADIDLTKLNIDNEIDNDELADDVASVATILFSAADISALNVTPKTLVPAPGAGKAIILEDIVFSFTYNSVQFTGGGVWRIQYNGQTTSIVTTLNIDSAINGAASFIRHYVAAAAASGITSFANTALEVVNITASHANGNSTMKAFVKYRIVTL